MKKGKQLLQFDWAMKKMLRHKANFDILEGFLSELLGEAVTIRQILESESNKEVENDKFNRVDILIENEKRELIIIEIQNSMEYDYFHRILYGASKVITEHIKAPAAYSEIRKVISITIAYFDLGQGKDYIYHGVTSFKGVHKGDILRLSGRQKELYQQEHPYQIFPEYYLIKVSQFNDRVRNTLDEWIYFLKNGEVLEEFTAKGLSEAQERLTELKLTDEERGAYRRYLRQLHDIASEEYNKMVDIQMNQKEAEQKAHQQGMEQGLQQGLQQGIEQGIQRGIQQGIEQGIQQGAQAGAQKAKLEMARLLKAKGMSLEEVAAITGLSQEEVASA
ncbi:MAG: Rpn family recombination-promoting nuclease/putative transposase [Bacteroidia bacterium]|nr:Rpn family recombination-promoting nuclease/putative transposase [Bacteroidia bacterium]